MCVSVVLLAPYLRYIWQNPHTFVSHMSKAAMSNKYRGPHRRVIVYTCIHMYVHIHIYMYAQICICVYTFKDVYIYIYI